MSVVNLRDTFSPPIKTDKKHDEESARQELEETTIRAYNHKLSDRIIFGLSICWLMTCAFPRWSSPIFFEQSIALAIAWLSVWKYSKPGIQRTVLLPLSFLLLLTHASPWAECAAGISVIACTGEQNLRLLGISPVLSFACLTQVWNSLWVYWPLNDFCAHLVKYVGPDRVLSPAGLTILPASVILFATLYALSTATTKGIKLAHRFLLLSLGLACAPLTIYLGSSLLAWAILATLVALQPPLASIRKPSVVRPLVGFGLIFVATLSVLTAGLGFSTSRPPVVGLVDGGLKTLSLPSRNYEKERTDPDFSGLKLLVAEYGMSWRELPEHFTPSDLSGLGELVVINPTKTWEDSTTTKVESWVRAGGSMLVLGDHTDIGGLRDPVNKVIRATSIRLNYDSAIPVDSNMEWQDSLSTGVGNSLSSFGGPLVGICVGASLRVGASAQILVGADAGYSDKGDPKRGTSHLGNMQHDNDERSGGLTLVAEEPLGKGTVQVWGDTTGFQNASLSLTHKTVASVMHRLLTRTPPKMNYWVAGIVIAVFGLVGTFLLSTSAKWGLAASLACLLGALVGSIFVEKFSPRQVKASAVLDTSCSPAYPTSDKSDAIGRFSEVMVRGNLLLTAQSDFDLALNLKPSHFVIVAPSRQYSDSQASRLNDFVQEGGKLVIFGGRDCRNNLLPILRHFDLDIDGNPYGPAHNARISNPEWLKEIWGKERPLPDSVGYDAEVHFVESFPLEAPNSSVLAECWGRPLAIRKTVGAGTVTLVGDSRFVTAKAQGAVTPDLINARFLLKLFE